MGIPWASSLAFVRIVSNPRLFPTPLGIGEAWDRVVEWLALPNVWIPTETGEHLEVLGRLLRDSGAGGNLVPDAHLAALAISHTLTLCSTDRDFSRFPGLRFENPLSGTVTPGSRRRR